MSKTGKLNSITINLVLLCCCLQKEIEGCWVLTSKIVWNDLEEGQGLNYISKHLGLRPVSLKTSHRMPPRIRDFSALYGGKYESQLGICTENNKRN